MDKFYITTSIPYVNDKPHIGHALEYTETDALARYQRLVGKKVFFATGTDEHGAKIARSAESAKKGAREFTDENSEKFLNLLKQLNILNDDFIRTSDETRHFKGAQKLWEKIEDAGDIYKGNYNGMYCVGCEAFITEKDLIDGKCEVHEKAPEHICEENYFFRLSKYSEEIKSKILSGEFKIFPETRKNEILSLLNSGLEDISFSRPSKDLPWGVPVPGDATQTMYVWCDALANYITVLGYGSESELRFEEFWPADLHIIGKDILRFHAAIWPAMLLSAKIPLPKAIFVHGFINAKDGRKMSKSIGNVVNPSDLIEKFGADAFRHYFLSQVPRFEDHDFSSDKFLENYNARLANGLGNLVQRTAKMAESYFKGSIAKPEEEFVISVPLKKELNILSKTRAGESAEFFSVPYNARNFILPEYVKFMDSFDFNGAIDLLWIFLSKLDKYIDDYKPFILIKTDEEKTKAILWSLLYGIGFFAVLVSPFLPETANRIFKILGKEDLKNLKLGDGFFNAFNESVKEFQIDSDFKPLFLRME